MPQQRRHRRRQPRVQRTARATKRTSNDDDDTTCMATAKTTMTSSTTSMTDSQSHDTDQRQRQHDVHGQCHSEVVVVVDHQRDGQPEPRLGPPPPPAMTTTMQHAWPMPQQRCCHRRHRLPPVRWIARAMTQTSNDDDDAMCMANATVKSLSSTTRQTSHASTMMTMSHTWPVPWRHDGDDDDAWLCHGNMMTTTCPRNEGCLCTPARRRRR